MKINLKQFVDMIETGGDCAFGVLNDYAIYVCQRNGPMHKLLDEASDPDKVAKLPDPKKRSLDGEDNDEA